MYFIDVGNGVGVYPNNGDNIEKISPLMVILWVGKDSFIDSLQQFMDNLIEFLKSSMLILLQTYINRLK